LLLRLLVQACGRGRTDLHVVGGELAEPKLPLILGNEIVGGVVEKGESRARRGPASGGDR
jgi:propanol-preferring alcohol dehydrogenase